MKKLGIALLIAALVIVILIVSIGKYYQQYYLVWMVRESLLLIFGILICLGCVFMKLEDGIGGVQKFLVRGGGGVIGLITLSMVFSGEVNGFADIGSYFSKDYRQVTGVPTILERMTRRDKTQDIEVNNIKLLNTHKGLEEHEDKVIEFYYLPESKFIVKMRIQ